MTGAKQSPRDLVGTLPAMLSHKLAGRGGPLSAVSDSTCYVIIIPRKEPQCQVANQ